MTLAATPAATAAMASLATHFKPTNGERVPDNAAQSCTFTCHWSATDLDYHKLAVQNNVQLRITVLQSAVGGVIDTLAGPDTDNRFRLGLYSFGRQFNVVYGLSADITGATNSLPPIAPGVNFCTDDVSCPDTYFSQAMTQLTALALPLQAGAPPQRFLFIVGDGVYDQYVSNQRQIGAFNPADCAALKAIGVTILLLYTPYLPLPTNSYYLQHIQNTVPSVAAEIIPNLPACASSPSYYFIGNDATDITTKMQNMPQLVVPTTSHLTN